MNVKQNPHRIPTPGKPLHEQYIYPIAQFLSVWDNDSTFYQDFIHSCPFNNSLLEHFDFQTRICTTSNAWKNLFKYLTTHYAGKELIDLVYEALHDLGQSELYLKFLINHHYKYIWPTGDDFCDPSLELPEKP